MVSSLVLTGCSDEASSGAVTDPTSNQADTGTALGQDVRAMDIGVFSGADTLSTPPENEERAWLNHGWSGGATQMQAGAWRLNAVAGAPLSPQTMSGGPFTLESGRLIAR